MSNEPLYKIFLRRELEQRQAKNARYSLRAFASFLEISPGCLSRALNDKASLSIKILERALTKLNVSDTERSRYLVSSIEEQQKRAIKKSGFQTKTIQNELSIDEIESSVMDQMVEWYHFAILELAAVDGFKLSTRSIAQALGISKEDAESAILRLLQRGLLRRVISGFEKTKPVMLNKNRGTMTSDSIRNYLDQTLAKAQESLRRDPLPERSMTSMMIPIDPRKLPVAKLMMEQFVLQMCEYLSAERKERVYNLNVNLFPIQTVSSETL